MSVATEATLLTIERRARLYRRLVQALIASVAVMIAIAVWRSLSTLVYVPAVGVLLVGLWAAADAAELSRWRQSVADLGVAPALLHMLLRARTDVPRATVEGMLKSLSGDASPYRWPGVPTLALAAALACGGRAVEKRSIFWGIVGAGVLLLSKLGTYVYARR